MNILVTGGTGIISSGIVEEAVKQGHTTYAVTRGTHEFRNVKGVNYIKADVRNKEKMNEILDNISIDVVVECLVYTTEQLQTSLDIFSNRCKQYIFISTAGIYGRNDNLVDENTEQSQIEWKYSKNKIECEKMLKEYYEDIKDRYYTIVRPFVTYGNYRVPFPVVSRENHWTIFERINQNCPIVACDNVKFPIIHIKDFSYAIVKLFNNEKAKNQAFHIAESGKEIYWDDVIKESAKILNKNVEIIHIPLEVFKKVFYVWYEELKWNKTTEMYVDDKKIKAAIGNFEQKVDISQGMKMTIEAQRKENEDGYNTLDYEWWTNCDLILIYSYLRNKLNTNERKIVKEYIKRISKRNKIKVIKLYIKQKARNTKRIIKKLIGRI